MILKHITGYGTSDVGDAQINLGSRTRERERGNIEIVIFPGEKETKRWEMPIFSGRLKEMEAEAEFHKSGKMSQDTGGDGYVVHPILVGCVDYEFPFSTGQHQTWFAYEVLLRTGHSIVLDGPVTIPEEELMVRQPGMALNYAD